jgi:hypothetical protein
MIVVLKEVEEEQISEMIFVVEEGVKYVIKKMNIYAEVGKRTEKKSQINYGNEIY